MHLFIDESGGFQRDVNTPHAVSCVCAVVIPGRSLDAIEDGFLRISHTWPKEASGEVKGKLLDEEHMRQLCDFLSGYHVILDTTVIDMNMSTDDEVKYHKFMQAESIIADLSPEHDVSMHLALEGLKRSLDLMPIQLYAQAVAMKHLVWNSFQVGQIYFCQRWPGELARFQWTIDAKDKGRTTEYERYWQESILPSLQSISMTRPLIRLKGGDYSAFRRNFPSLSLPKHLRELAPSDQPRNRRKGGDLRALFRELKFAQSDVHVGLQIADVLANCIRRSLSGRMGRAGWWPLASLMTKKLWSDTVLITLSQDPAPRKAVYGSVLERLNSGERPLLSEGK